jgi:drug/metabolite transporter (DMT)-like permease
MRRPLYKEYPTKVWLTTVFVPPIINVVGLFVAFDYTSNDIRDAWVVDLYMTGIGILLSLPSLVIFTFAFRELSRNRMSNVLKRLTLALLGIFLIFTTFYLLNREYISNSGKEAQIIIGSYLIVFTIAALFFDTTTQKWVSEC